MDTDPIIDEEDGVVLGVEEDHVDTAKNCGKASPNLDRDRIQEVTIMFFFDKNPKYIIGIPT